MRVVTITLPTLELVFIKIAIFTLRSAFKKIATTDARFRAKVAS